MRPYVTVECHEVEYGDEIAGLPGHPIVCSILLDCSDGLSWIYADADHRIIARRPLGSRLQVVRAAAEGEAIPPAPSAAERDDDCPVAGIPRPLRLVRR